MINPKLIFLLLFGTAILTWACRPGATPDSEVPAIINAMAARNFAEARQRMAPITARENGTVYTVNEANERHNVSPSDSSDTK